MALDSALTAVERVTSGVAKSGATRVCSFVVTAAAANASAVLRDGGAGGTALVRLAAVIGSSAVWTSDPGIVFSTDVYVELTGAGAACSVGYKPLN